MTDEAFRAVVDALARRDLTAEELRDRLERAGFDDDTCADAIARARSAGYLDDVRVAAERAPRLAERGSSDAAIRQELLRRGVDEEAVETVLASLTPELDRAAHLARKFGGGARAARALARKGYSADVVSRVLGLPIAE